MTRDEYKTLTREVVRGLQKDLTPDNKSTLDKFSEDAEKLNYNGKPLQVEVSSEEGNNLCQKQDGLYAMNTYVTSESSPVGEIIAFMGTVCPDHYVFCDGTEYPLGTYPILERFFTKQFGSVNHFGGNGETTFAVPDLRGEFLRGTGAANRNTGSGSSVGEHQRGTIIPGLWHEDTNKLYFGSSDSFDKEANDYLPQYIDRNYSPLDLGGTVRKSMVFAIANTDHNYPEWTYGYTTRPTNTSVMYCIKYEPTITGGSDGSTDAPLTKEEKDEIIAFIIASNDDSTEESEV